MKRKQLAKRVAIAMLSAATVMTSVPATAVFATQNVSTEALYALANAQSFKLTKDGTEIKSDTTDSDDAALYGALSAVQFDTSNDAVEANKLTADNAVTKVTKALASYTATNIKATVSGKTATVTFDLPNHSYVATYAMVKTTALADSETSANVTAAGELDDWFESDGLATTLRTYEGETLNDAAILAAYKTAIGNSDKAVSSLKTAIVASSVNRITPTVTDFAKNGNNYSGNLVWTDNTNNVIYTYAFSGTTSSSTESKTALVDAAVKSVQANALPDGADTAGQEDAPNTIGVINKALTAALKDTGATATAAVVTGTDNKALYTPATHDKEGSIVVFVSGASNAKAPVTFTLKQSSTQKLNDSNTAIGTVLKHGTDIYVASKKDTAPVAADAVTGKLFTFSSTSKLSRSVQDRKATKPVDKEKVRAAVESAINDAVKDYADAGVTYKTELVDTKYALLADDSPATVGTATDPVKEATSEAAPAGEGHYLVKVTASIANDFFYTDAEHHEVKADAVKGNAAGTNAKVNSNVYYVLVETGKLDEVKTTGISLADQTVVLNKDKKLDSTTGTAKALEDGDEADSMAVDITPTLTPADANGSITWSVEGKDVNGVDIATDIYIAGSKDGDGTTLGNKAAQLVVQQPGTYKVTATYDKDGANEVKAEATITVNKSFTDVDATQYYADPITWGYKKGIVAGTGNGDFKPNKTVTRAQYVSFLYRLAVKQNPKAEIKDADVNINSTFSDVSNTAYYAKAVQWAVKNGVTAGIGNGKFNPDGNVNRAQAVTFIYRMKGQPDTGANGSALAATQQFTDVKAGDYFQSAVTWGVNTDAQKTLSDKATKIVSGLSNTTFGPNTDATRAQAITFIARAFATQDEVNALNN